MKLLWSCSANATSSSSELIIINNKQNSVAGSCCCSCGGSGQHSAGTRCQIASSQTFLSVLFGSRFFPLARVLYYWWKTLVTAGPPKTSTYNATPFGKRRLRLNARPCWLILLMDGPAAAAEPNLWLNQIELKWIELRMNWNRFLFFFFFFFFSLTSTLSRLD